MTSSKILIPVYFNFNQTQKNDCRFENGLNGIDVEYKLVREANFYKYVAAGHWAFFKATSEDIFWRFGTFSQEITNDSKIK